ncbi:MaoC family dehydratase [Proteiniclasticum ruminis]|jgi:3-hydroxybutyryl-CoA dehydratase|uniref:3-hydroxybutyryl-CoA dehydratase n=1 Tax=Proteiniclasticum ruminis TaxID=398199 RepID=A0A1G8M7P3_9CLOT|nr:MaoC family dehydratase [Proteiniclasticum ruminis]SDI63931.1 3-hydroxybutyryl-CoA dehydratase [Proteiniclasticum ruminis]SFN65417.1 3-hydroxybutyryl-CoA dehydratase [Proteiniclasticum ruminis]
MKGKTIHDMRIGDQESYERTVTETDVVLFGGISGDLNPAHFNESYAKETMFKGRIVHGMLTASYFSTVLGTLLPGPGTIYLGQDLKFTKPVRFQDTIKAVVTVSEILEEKNIVKLDTIAYNQHGDVVVKGTATVMPPK